MAARQSAYSFSMAVVMLTNGTMAVVSLVNYGDDGCELLLCVWRHWPRRCCGEEAFGRSASSFPFRAQALVLTTVVMGVALLPVEVHNTYGFHNPCQG